MAGIACQLQRNAKLIKNILKTAKMREQNVALRKIKGKKHQISKKKCAKRQDRMQVGKKVFAKDEGELR